MFQDKGEVYKIKKKKSEMEPKEMGKLAKLLQTNTSIIIFEIITWRL